MSVCANCEHSVRAAFCEHCGQRAHVPAFTWRYVFHELPAGVFAWDRGALYTAKQLFTRPGHTIREYIAGKRISHFRPIPLLAFCAGLMGLMGYLLEAPIGAIRANGDQEGVKLVMDWINGHYVWIELASLPFISFSTWLFFRKQGFNLVEHVVINSFLASQRLILNLVLMPLIFIFDNKVFIMLQSAFVTLLSLGLFVWAFTQLFQPMGALKVSFRTLTAYGFAYLLIALLALSVVYGLSRTGQLQLN